MRVKVPWPNAQNVVVITQTLGAIVLSAVKPVNKMMDQNLSRGEDWDKEEN